MSRRREEKEHQGEDSWGEASLTPGRLESLPWLLPSVLPSSPGWKCRGEVSVSQVAGQSVPQHGRPRTVLKGVAWAGVEELPRQRQRHSRRAVGHFPWSPAESLVAGLHPVQWPQGGDRVVTLHFLSCSILLFLKQLGSVFVL